MKLKKAQKKIQAVNTVLFKEGRATATNTDCLGAMMALGNQRERKNQHALVLGAGGSARAIVYALIQEGIKVTILNRTLENAQKLADEFGAHALSFETFAHNTIEKVDLLIQTTTVGMGEDSSSLIPACCLNSKNDCHGYHC